jgi:imidazolonepropionase-like amidohydrolase
LQTATKNAADVMRRGNQLGTVEQGKLADIIVVNGNPLVDMDALYHVEAVIKDGIRYK